MEIIIGTANPGKLKEITAILAPLGFDVTAKSMDIDETGETIHENAVLKAIEYSNANPGKYVVSEDSGLVVPALAGLPGVYSARFHTIKNLTVGMVDGQPKIMNVFDVPKEVFTTDKTDYNALNNKALLKFLSNIPKTKWNAYYEACFVLAYDGMVLGTFEGRTDGHIIEKARGENGFGYDPIFAGDECDDKTFAEIPQEMKNRISHRGKALNKLIQYLNDNLKQSKS